MDNSRIKALTTDYLTASSLLSIDLKRFSGTLSDLETVALPDRVKEGLKALMVKESDVLIEEVEKLQALLASMKTALMGEE